MSTEEYIQRNGATYKYDPDYDCYYRVCTANDLNHWNTYSWLYVIAALAVFCYAVV